MPKRSNKTKIRHSRVIKTFGGQNETLPIKDEKQLKEFMYYFLKKAELAKTDVKKYQAERNYMLCLIGCSTGFRAEDLLQLRVEDVIDGYVHIKENKTGKMQNFKMNKNLHQDILDYVERWSLTRYDYMFLGQMKINPKSKGKHIYPITRQQAHKIVSNAAKEVGINFTFGLHSLRKTFGYFYIKDGGKPETLMKMYNHDDYNVTMRYVHWGIDDAEHDREGRYVGGFIKKKGK